MARKSRKNIIETKFTTNNKIYNVGIYVRLSVFDDNKKDNDTIENQKNIILDYLKDKEEFKIISIYEDTNFTGTNFNRCGFERLLEDVKKGKINCIIVKDLSRFGRNYIECGNYLEKIFPFMNIRFIAINDNYDSNNENANQTLTMHLKNIVNEIYAKDISKKIKTVIREKQKKGEFTGGYASYGYLKDSENKNKIIVNKETAPIVKKIFELRLQGYSYNKIAIILNQENILSPYAYLYRIGILKKERFKNTKWNFNNVKTILNNEVYIGNMVQGRKKCQSINKSVRVNNKDEWRIAYNTHTPIISEEIFFKVQKINNNARAIYEENNKNYLNKKKTENIFKSVIKCGECKKRLIRLEKTKKSNVTEPIFICKTHNINECSFTQIKESIIKEVVFNEVKKKINILLNLSNLLEKSTNDTSLLEKQLIIEIDNLSQEIEKVKTFKNVIYEDYLNQTLSKEEYIFIKSKNLKKEEDLIKKIEDLKNELNYIKANLTKGNELLNNFLKFKNEKVLTKGLIETLIKEIVIKDKRLYITFNYTEEFEKLIEKLEVLKNAV